jgi:adenine-specific DNA-methyltransferase
MSRLSDLIARVRAVDPMLGANLEAEVRALSARRPFGLNFERHAPESVELPGRPVRRGDKVRILPPRGSTAKGDRQLWLVKSIESNGAGKLALLERPTPHKPDPCRVHVDELVVVAEEKDFLYPGLVSTGKVERGGAKPFHTVINGENLHALKALTCTHRGKIDVIYIDPPYNTGAKDWKYNNDYVEKDDLYRHSKWLAFIERRLIPTRDLLNTENSVLIITIDEKEYLRLGLLLEQTFPEAEMQMVSIRINPSGVARGDEFRRSDEYAFFLKFGEQRLKPCCLGEHWLLEQRRRSTNTPVWNKLRRTGTNSARSDRPKLFFPLFIDPLKGTLVHVGEPLPAKASIREIVAPDGLLPIWPIRADGTEGNWQIGPEAVRTALAKGYIRLGNPTKTGYAVYYLKAGEQKKIESGHFQSNGRRSDGSIIFEPNDVDQVQVVPSTQWAASSHDSATYGSRLIGTILPSRRFPFPKSLYAVEDALRFFTLDKPRAVILDFFAGSGTTAHAVTRLNKQDGGNRQCISITNNEVAADEQTELRKQRLRPGDPEWETWGICEHITKPRIRAAITGHTPEGDPIKGDYKFTDEFPMAEGFAENAEFFTLSYEAPVAVSHNRALERIAPLLWLRAGSEGRRIDKLPKAGFDVADTYGLLTEVDETRAFMKAVKASKALRMVFIVTDDERRFQAIAQRLPQGVEPVRLYESYLTNFRFAVGR